MTILIWTILTQVLGGFPALAAVDTELYGKWQYDGFFYDGHRYPNPNLDLELTFTFDRRGQSRLYWTRKSENGFCERIATYQTIGPRLVQKVTWVNPSNAAECAKDSDMQMGKETEIEICIVGPELSFHFNLNGKPFLYILKRVARAEDGNSQVLAPQ